MSDQEPHIIQTDADWDETYYFWLSRDTSSPRDLTGWSMSGALQRLGSDDPPFLISSELNTVVVSGNSVAIHVTMAEKADVAVDDFELNFVLISPEGSREGGYWYPYRNRLGGAT